MMNKTQTRALVRELEQALHEDTLPLLNNIGYTCRLLLRDMQDEIDSRCADHPTLKTHEDFLCREVNRLGVRLLATAHHFAGAKRTHKGKVIHPFQFTGHRTPLLNLPPVQVDLDVSGWSL